MKNWIKFFILVSVILVIVFIVYGSKDESIGEYIDDSVITTTIKSQLGGNDFFKSFQIGVETHKGIVQLSGFVDSQNAVNKAEEIVKGIKGVKSIENGLIVKESKDGSVGEYIDDSVITATIKSKLGGNDFFKSFQIGVETRKGIVQLSGFVDSRNVVNKAEEIVKGIKGVKSVENNLIIK